MGIGRDEVSRPGLTPAHGVVRTVAANADPAALVAGVGSRRAALLPLTQVANACVQPLALFARQATGELIEVF